jgi:protein gp37
MAKTKIPWATESWNPIRFMNGWMCTKISPGCLNCYAEAMNLRFGNGYEYGELPEGPKFQLDERVLNQPFHWRKPRQVFAQSMGDLFHKDIPFEFVTRIFDVMCSWRWPSKAAEREGDESELIDPGHTWNVLTKRPERIPDWLNWVADRWPGDTPFNCEMTVRGKIPPHIRIGVSIESEKYLPRINHLLSVPAAVRFVSFEPLLSPIHFPKDVLLCAREEDESSPVACIPCSCGKHWMNQTIPENYRLECLDWVIVAPETGSQRRRCEPDWIKSIIDQCDAADVPVFVKAFPMVDYSWNTGASGRGGRISHDPAEWPEWARRREYPK